MPTFSSLMHPEYLRMIVEWRKWRVTYLGGFLFMHQYMKRYTSRETNEEFKDRKEISYVPAFAKQALHEIRMALYSRLPQVKRIGGSDSYHAAMRGEMGGVDLCGNNITTFIGARVLPELLTMAKVGIYVDMPELTGITIADVRGKHPYIYAYPIEDIFNWTFDPISSQLTSVLLRDYNYQQDEITGLPTVNVSTTFRLVKMVEGGVEVEFQNAAGQPREDGPSKKFIPGLKRIPFIVAELPDSLLTDVADYQIALMNLASSDINYIFRANFPIYTEQHDPRLESNWIKGATGSDSQLTRFGELDADDPQPGQNTAAQEGKAAEVALGVGKGRRYPKGLERPGFVSPSSEPLVASMQKQEQMKMEIRNLVHLTVANIGAKMASAESKDIEFRGLEAGLFAIGAVLEGAERRIAEHWAAYENTEAATVRYPEKYTVQTDESKLAEVKELKSQTDSVPSRTFQREISKKIASVLLSDSISVDTMEKIHAEIDKSEAMHTEPETIMTAVENGILSAETAGSLMGFPKGESDKAAGEHAARLARLAIAQTPDGGMAAARGVGDMGADPKAGSKEKKKAQDKTGSKDLKDKERGPGDGDE